MKLKMGGSRLVTAWIIWSLFIKINYRVFMSGVFKCEKLQAVFCGDCGSKLFITFVVVPAWLWWNAVGFSGGISGKGTSALRKWGCPQVFLVYCSGGGRTKGLAIIGYCVYRYNFRHGISWYWIFLEERLTLKHSIENWLEEDRKWHIKKVWLYSKQAEEDQALNSCFFIFEVLLLEKG